LKKAGGPAEQFKRGVVEFGFSWIHCRSLLCVAINRRWFVGLPYGGAE